MKYHTIGSSNSAPIEKRSSLTIYADMDIPQNKIYTESEIKSIRGELEIVQKTLKLQTRRCRQLVAEYTRRLQEKEHQYMSERALRDDQLAKVLRALLIFEARLRQEQKYITSQLSEKELIIKKQNSDIRKLLTNQYCKNCSQYYASSPIQESLDSSTEYVLTDCQEYQSSNYESLDSSITLSEKDFNKSESSYEDNSKEQESKNIYQKNRNKDSFGRRSKKIQHRKSIGTYFEVLKMRNENNSPISNEDNTSNDYENLDSLPPESIDNKITRVTENIEQIFEENYKIVTNSNENGMEILHEDSTMIDNKAIKNKDLKKPFQITESIPVFEGGEESNENWYASASDQEDDEQRDIYRNNPVLECMNQILLQNINDALNSPPKTPNIERKPAKNKRVKFSDEEIKEETKENSLTEENLKEKEDVSQDYYETPIQNSPNFYETPQSIYSNDYEQILSKCSETFTNIEKNNLKDSNPHYIDMDEKQKIIETENKLVKKSKILRTPPALPPKPINLVSKYKIQVVPKTPPSEKSEPDYCSISELNLPQSFKKISVVAEINAPTSLDIINKLNNNDVLTKTETDSSNSKDSMVVKKCVEKIQIQLAKQTTIKSDPISPKKKDTIEIPKLPQVSEILIPESEDEEKDKEERINQDNYMRNNTQILKIKNTTKESGIRKPVVMGSTVSSLISTFNNQQLLNEIKNSTDKNKINKTMFSNLENRMEDSKTPNFEKFDLSQTFEEFKLDDCEIEEYTVEEIKTENGQVETAKKSPSKSNNNTNEKSSLTRCEIELFKKRLEMQHKQQFENIKGGRGVPAVGPNEPTYEHFLECTGLSTKSLLTPARMLSNHKNVMKPKDIKFRSTVKANNFFDNHNNTVKYWSEPYI